MLLLPENERDDLFVFKPLWQRAIIVAAGPLINFAFAILILAGFYMALWPSVHAAGGVRRDRRWRRRRQPASRRVIGSSAIDGSAIERFEDIVTIVMSGTG